MSPHRPGMEFELALACLKRGKPVRRRTWRTELCLQAPAGEAMEWKDEGGPFPASVISIDDLLAKDWELA